ncbi:hypothetical protein BaRGS_00039033, partial [Batillaria attramentaria]
VGKYTSFNTQQCECVASFTDHLTSHVKAISNTSVKLIAPRPYDNSAIPTVLVYLGIVYCLLAFWAYGKEQEDTRMAYEKEQEDTTMRKVTVLPDNEIKDKYIYLLCVITAWLPGAGTSARVYFYLRGSKGRSNVHKCVDVQRTLFTTGSFNWFLITCPASLGRIQSIVIWHDSTGPTPSWFLQEVYVRDIQTEQTWHCVHNNWLAVSHGNGELCVAIPALTPRQASLQQSYQFLFKLKSLVRVCSFTSPFFKPEYNTYNRVYRLTVRFTVMVFIMAFITVIDAPKEGIQQSLDDPKYKGGSALFLGLISGSIVFGLQLVADNIFALIHPKPATIQPRKEPLDLDTVVPDGEAEMLAQRNKEALTVRLLMDKVCGRKYGNQESAEASTKSEVSSTSQSQNANVSAFTEHTSNAQRVPGVTTTGTRDYLLDEFKADQPAPDSTYPPKRSSESGVRYRNTDARLAMEPEYPRTTNDVGGERDRNMSANISSDSSSTMDSGSENSEGSASGSESDGGKFIFPQEDEKWFVDFYENIQQARQRLEDKKKNPKSGDKSAADAADSDSPTLRQLLLSSMSAMFASSSFPEAKKPSYNSGKFFLKMRHGVMQEEVGARGSGNQASGNGLHNVPKSRVKTDLPQKGESTEVYKSASYSSGKFFLKMRQGAMQEKTSAPVSGNQECGSGLRHVPTCRVKTDRSQKGKSMDTCESYSTKEHGRIQTEESKWENTRKGTRTSMGQSRAKDSTGLPYAQDSQPARGRKMPKRSGEASSVPGRAQKESAHYSEFLSAAEEKECIYRNTISDLTRQHAQMMAEIEVNMNKNAASTAQNASDYSTNAEEAAGEDTKTTSTADSKSTAGEDTKSEGKAEATAPVT